jgi:hypothetical protein
MAAAVFPAPLTQKAGGGTLLRGDTSLRPALQPTAAGTEVHSSGVRFGGERRRMPAL